jgi:hypothetical protein
MIDLFKRFARLFGFYRESPISVGDYFTSYPAPSEAEKAEWARLARNVANDPEYRATMAANAVNANPAAEKARRLASIARERCLLKDKLAVAIRQKKARAPIYQALRALSVEELNVEAGK